jgi:hypothetical protein
LGGWYSYGLSKAGTHCKFLICPDCLDEHFEREIQRHEFYVKWHRKQQSKQGTLGLFETDDAEQRW